jgi:hypothetical protein
MSTSRHLLIPPPFKIRFWFLVPGFWFLVSGFWFLVPGFWFLVSGCRVQLQDSGCWSVVARRLLVIQGDVE